MRMLAIVEIQVKAVAKKSCMRHHIFRFEKSPRISFHFRSYFFLVRDGKMHEIAYLEMLLLNAAEGEMVHYCISHTEQAVVIVNDELD